MNFIDGRKDDSRLVNYSYYLGLCGGAGSFDLAYDHSSCEISDRILVSALPSILSGIPLGLPSLRQIRIAFGVPEKRKKLVTSMDVLAAIVIGVGLGTLATTTYFRSQDPIYQCIGNPPDQSYQPCVPIILIEDGFPVIVRKEVGIEKDCTRPAYTIEKNIIHVAYSGRHDFILGHFPRYWIGNDKQKYYTKVYVNATLYTEGSFLNMPTKGRRFDKIEFTSLKLRFLSQSASKLGVRPKS